MIMEKFLKDVILEVSMRLPCGGAFLDFRNDEHLTLIENVLQSRGIPTEQIDGIVHQLAEKGEEKNELSINDINTLKGLGLRLKSESDYKSLKIDEVDIESVVFNTGGGARVFEENVLKFRKLYSYVKTSKIVHVTTASSINKMRSADNIRICQWGPSRGPGSANYDQIIAVFKLFKQFPATIKISSQPPQGINYEMQKVEELNDILTKSAVPSTLYIFKDKRVVPMNVSVKSAIKVTGVGKADIALENEKKQEVFWISYKFGDYFGKQGQVLLSVPFQQYGSLQGLYDSGFANRPLASDKDVPGKEIQRLINAFIKSVLTKTGLTKQTIKNAVRVDAKGKNVLIYVEGNKVVTIPPGHPIHDLAGDPVILKKMAKNVRKEGRLNLHFFLQGTPEHYFDMMKESEMMDQETLNTIAGKSIYGTDFFIGNTDFGRENINMLLQTSQKLIVSQHKSGDEPDGLILRPDAQGHILLNPNLPTAVTDELQRVIDVYLPVLFTRFTRNEAFKWTDETGKNMIFGGRFLILPKGKMPSKAVEIEL